MKQIHLDSCDSTQDILKEQLRLNPNEEFLISCERQLHGRGRGSHTWDDSPGTVCFSMNITPHIISSFTAIEVTLLISKFFEETGHVTKLKWPNDLLTKAGLKCGGVLIQTSSQNYLAGIGINLYSEKSEYGGVHDGPFTFDKSRWSFEIADYIHKNRYESTKNLISDWEQRCLHMKKMIRIIDDQQETNGIFNGLGEHGEALIQVGDQETKIYNGSLRII